MKTSKVSWFLGYLCVFCLASTAFAGDELPQAVTDLFEATQETRFERIQIVSAEQEGTGAIRVTQVFDFPAITETVEMEFFYEAREDRWEPKARPEEFTVLGDWKPLPEERAAFERLLAKRFSADLSAGEFFAPSFVGLSRTPLYLGSWQVTREPMGEDLEETLHLPCIYVIDYGHTVAAFPSFETILSSEIWIQNLDPDYRLRSADDAARFQKVLHRMISVDNRLIGPFQKGNRWFFPLRVDYSAKVKVNEECRVQKVTFLDRLTLPQQAEVDWYLKLIEPAEEPYWVPMGTSFPFGLEFPLRDATLAGAYMVLQSGERTMVLASPKTLQNATSHGVPADMLRDELNTVTFHLTRDPADLTDSLARLTIEVEARSLFTEGDDFGLALIKPSESPHTLKRGQDLRIVLDFDKERVQSAKLSMVIRCQGREIADLDTGFLYLPFEEFLPAHLFRRGVNELEFVLMAPHPDGPRPVSSVALEVVVE